MTVSESHFLHIEQHVETCHPLVVTLFSYRYIVTHIECDVNTNHTKSVRARCGIRTHEVSRLRITSAVLSSTKRIWHVQLIIKPSYQGVLYSIQGHKNYTVETARAEPMI